LILLNFSLNNTPLYLDWEEEEEGRLRPAFTVKTSGRPNWQTTRNLFEKSTNKFKNVFLVNLSSAACMFE
jgi:hypothetical protein